MPGKMAPMICPTCGIPMNHHANKLIHPTGDEDPGRVDPVLGGLVEEIHECKECGCTGSRSAK